MTLRNQLEHFFCLNTSRKDPCVTFYILGVQLPSSCVDIALGVDHTLFLCTGGTVFSCGLNTFHQLGHHPPPPLLLAPVPISAKSSAPKYPAAVGVAAAKVHSVFWTDDSLYTWGLNAGQLGHLRGDKTIIQPKLVSSLTRDKICLVSVSDGATVALTAKGDVMALYEYNTKKLGQRQHNIVAMSVTGGQLDHCSGRVGKRVKFNVEEFDIKVIKIH